MQQKILTPEEIAANRCDLFTYTKSMFIARKGLFKENWHQHAICKALEQVIIGKSKRLIINIPPRSGKTELAIISFIAWCMGNWPDSEFIHASYSKRLATNNTFNARSLMQHQMHAQIFGEPRIRHDSNAKDEFRTEEGGVVYASGVGGSITGYGAGKMRDAFGGAILLDDPHKAVEAISDKRRENVIDWFKTTIESRKNNPNTPIIVIMQRLHEQDLVGWLLDGGNGEEWDLLKIPCYNENKELFWEEQFPSEMLERLEKTDPYIFAGQYLQEPAPLGGGIFQKIWLAHYDTAPDDMMITVSVDTGAKDQENNDPTAIQVWGYKDKFHHLLFSHNKRMLYPDIKTTVLNIAKRYNADVVLIEDKSTGQALIPDLRKETDLNIHAINPCTDKLTRAMATTSYFAEGRVLLPNTTSEWYYEFLDQLLRFPRTTHKDMVDALSQYLNWMTKANLSTSTSYKVRSL